MNKRIELVCQFKNTFEKGGNFLVSGLSYKFFTFLLCVLSISPFVHSQTKAVLENNDFIIKVDKVNGALSSFVVKSNNSDLISEKRLMKNFRMCLQSKGNLSNYIDGVHQKAESVIKSGNTITVRFSGMVNANGTYRIDLTYWITLKGDYVSFNAKVTNHDTDMISEFWFPRIGGWNGFGTRDAKLAIPGYNNDCTPNINLFKNYPGRRGLGAESAEWSTDYPGGMCMPWWDVYDDKSNTGLYMGYQDTICRFTTWHTSLLPGISGSGIYPGSWFTEKQLEGQPMGIVFSHVFYPFIHSGETLTTGNFIIRVHKGDWHNGSHFYRKWFIAHFPFDKSKSWLRKESSWFSSIIYQPEDKMITDFAGYNRWTKDAKKYGVGCYELLGWKKGGIDRGYPMYVPEKKVGGQKGFRSLLRSIRQRGDHCLVFVNYNMLDQNTDWYRKELYKYVAQDQFGNASWEGHWGESTLLARKGLTAPHIARASIVPRMVNILDKSLVQLVKDGAQGFQMDKVVAGYGLDFNPLNTAKPDVAACEGLIEAIGRLYQKCKAVNPDFCMASEFGLDRLIPYFDVAYRSASPGGISPLKYVFPEWTACMHIAAPRDFKGVNEAVLTGAVIDVEPDAYQGTLDQPLYRDLALYIGEINRLRNKLAPIIFLGKYDDGLHATVLGMNKKPVSGVRYKVWYDAKTGQRAIIVTNTTNNPAKYIWQFTDKNVKHVLLYRPFGKVVTISQGKPVTIKGEGLNILVEKL